MDNTLRDKKKNKQRRRSDQGVLESWKAIANYLNRSVRTVRRWEAAEGLPVHRHRHNGGVSVYAYCAELNAWRTAQQDPMSLEPAAKKGKSPRSSMSRIGWNAAIVVAAAFAGGMVARILPADPPNSGVNASTTTALPERLSLDRDALVVLPMSKLHFKEYWPESVARTVVLPVLSAWAEGRLQDALYESRRVREMLPSLPRETQGYLVAHLVGLSLAMGRIDDAEIIAALLQDSDRLHQMQTRILFAAGDKSGMRMHLRGRSGLEDDSAPLFMAIAGLIDEAVEIEAARGLAEVHAGHLEVLLAIAAMNEGDSAKARVLLTSAIEVLDAADQGYYFVALDILAQVLGSEGNVAEAIEVLETTVPQRDASAFNQSGLFWLLCQRQLALLHRQAGRESDAQRVEKALRDGLMLSDDDFPLARSLATA